MAPSACSTRVATALFLKNTAPVERREMSRTAQEPTAPDVREHKSKHRERSLAKGVPRPREETH